MPSYSKILSRTFKDAANVLMPYLTFRRFQVIAIVILTGVTVLSPPSFHIHLTTKSSHTTLADWLYKNPKISPLLMNFFKDTRNKEQQYRFLVKIRGLRIHTLKSPKTNISQSTNKINTLRSLRLNITRLRIRIGTRKRCSDTTTRRTPNCF